MVFKINQWEVWWFDPQSNQASFHSRHVYYMDGQWYTILRSVFRFSYNSKTVKQKNRPSLNSQGRSLTTDVWQGWPLTTLDKRCWCVSSVVVIVLICDLDEKTMIKVGIGMFGMRKFRYRYTGKNILVYRYFGLVKSWVLLDFQNHEMDEKSQNIEL